jgi:hypothetical protein
MQHQIQPREISASCSELVEEEIQSFLQAVDSYPARVAKEPGISFQQHFRSIIRAAEEDRSRHRSRTLAAPDV